MVYCIVLEILILLTSLVNIYIIFSKKNLKKVQTCCLFIIGCILLMSILIDTSDTPKWFYGHTDFRLIFIITNIIYVITNYIVYKNKK